MKEYYCKSCSYKTQDPSNWRKHKSSKKHIEKVDLVTTTKNGVSKIIQFDSNMTPKIEELKSYSCDYCKFITSYHGNLYKHIKRCLSKKLEEKNKELLIQENENLKKINDILRESLVNKTGSTSVNGNSVTEALYSKMK